MLLRTRKSRLERFVEMAVCLCVALALTIVTGCRSVPPPAKVDDGTSWAQESPPPPTNGSIYQAGREVSLFDNPVAHHVGDIVTIVLSEQTAAQKSATTTTTKNTTEAMPGATLLGKILTVHGAPVLNNNIADASKFDGEGNSAQSNSLTGYITVTVAKVLPNGNLFVRGEKWIGINQGQEYIRLTGVIRPIDLASNNSISSWQVANAKISYGGRGALADVNAQSWLARFFNSPWAPF